MTRRLSVVAALTVLLFNGVDQAHASKTNRNKRDGAAKRVRRTSLLRLSFSTVEGYYRTEKDGSRRFQQRTSPARRRLAEVAVTLDLKGDRGKIHYTSRKGKKKVIDVGTVRDGDSLHLTARQFKRILKASLAGTGTLPEDLFYLLGGMKRSPNGVDLKPSSTDGSNRGVSRWRIGGHAKQKQYVEIDFAF